MSEKTLKTRIQNKRGTTAEWATGTAPNFVPLDGELVIYKDVNKIKIGDGSTKVGDLPFVASNGLDALTYSGVINVDTIPQIDHTFSWAPMFDSNFNRTPVVGDMLTVLVNHQGIDDSYLCSVEITEYSFPALKGTYKNITKATGKDGKNGVDPLVWEGGVFYTRDNVAIGATVNMGPTSSFNRTPVAGDTYNVLLTQRNENDAEIASYFCQLKITQVVGGAFVSEITNLTKATGTDSKVKDVTLGGESMVNANGVVELQQTVMTDGCIPVWNNTEKIFIDSRCHNTVDGLQVEGNIGMYSSEHILDVNVQDGSFSYSDDGQNTIKKYALPITKDSGTLATMYKKYTKFTAFAVGDNLSGKTLLFNTGATYAQYFGTSKIIATSSGGYTISIASGPPTIRLLKSGTVVQLFADWALRPDGTTGTVWRVSSYTLPSDFGTVSTLNTESGGTTYTSIWHTLGLDGATTEYDLMNVEDVYHTIPKIVDNLVTQNSTMALSAAQGWKLNSEKAPKASPTFTGTVTFGNDTPLSVRSSVGTSGQVLTSRGTGSPEWANIPRPSNMVTTDTEQFISVNKRFASSSSQYPQTIISNNGIGIQSSETNTTIYSTFITKVSGGSPITINLPSSNGTLALTNQIPIKTATLSGTTLSITLS